MLATVRSDREDNSPASQRADAPPTPSSLPLERHGYAPAPENKIFGLVGTCLVFGATLAGLFLTFEHRFVAPQPSAPLVVNLMPLASPPVEKHEKEKPIPQKRQDKHPPVPPKAEEAPKPLIQLPTDKVLPRPTPSSPPTPASKPVEEAAPRAIPAPPAPQASSKAADDSWQGRVLARLGQYRRYPSGAQSRREQGVPYIRFVMDRDGKIVSSRLERSSGYPDLDREAISLPRRAQPLPKPPASVTGDTIELVVPVEFFMK